MTTSSAVADADRLLAAGRRHDAVLRIDAAVRSRDPEATLRAAIWRMVGDPLPRDLVKARALLDRAAALGQDDAAAIAVALTANGSGAPADWPGALARLRALAPRSAAAAAQLRMVAAMALDDAGRPTRLPSPVALHADPAIVRLPGFATTDECRHLMTVTRDIIAPAVVVDPRTGRQMRHPVRTSDGAVVGPTREDLVVRAINRRIAVATDTDIAQGEALAILRYAPGQEYRPHLDCIAGAANQRVRTLLLYLNDDFTGGETRFTRLGLTVAPKQGDALLFDNVGGDGRQLADSEHAGLPVRQGVKWLATRWIRARALDPWQPPA